jgi:4-amino-4-deoxy-L-arabinose transferase-like glycosyltransferase
VTSSVPEHRVLRWLREVIVAPVPLSREHALGLGLVFLLAFAVRSLYAADFAPLMYLPQQPGVRMVARYDETARQILKGEGILYPRQPDPARTGLMARPPGYALYLAGVYRTVGDSLFAAQLVQNVLTSLCCVAIAVVALRLLSPGVGLLAGAIAALSPHLGFASNLVLPDAMSAVPLLGALLLLTRAHPDREGGLWPSAAAGALLGAGAWLRPNVLLLPAFLAVVIVALARDRRRALGHGAALVAAAVAVISPITIRNWVIFGEFVPLSINGGLVIWHGTVEAGGREHGAFKHDPLVAIEEAKRYGKPSYAAWWAEPDGVYRDRERFRRAFAFIRAHPGAYARVMMGRMRDMLSYHSGLAATVALPGDPPPRIEEEPEPHDAPQRLLKQKAGEGFLWPGAAASFLRVPTRLAQQALLVVLLPLVAVGTAVLLLADVRRAGLLLAISLYYLLTESFFWFEWRVVVPMHYGLFTAAAAALAVAATGARHLATRARRG